MCYSKHILIHLQMQNREYAIVIQVLQSKRLLSDHVEILEDYVNIREFTEANYGRMRLALSGVGLVACGVAHNIVSNAVRNVRIGVGIAALGMGILAGRQCLSLYTERKRIGLLKRQLDALNEYHVVMKMNLNYLSEMFLLNRGVEREETLARSSVCSMIAVLSVLHKAVSDWDDVDPVTNELLNYQKFEAFDWGSYNDNCPQATTSKRLKELFNIFLYIQSQFVLRTCIALIENPHSELYDELGAITMAIQAELRRKDLQPRAVGKKILCSELVPDRRRADDQVSKLKWTCLSFYTKVQVQLGQLEGLNRRLDQLTNTESASHRTVMELYELLNNLEPTVLTAASEFDNALLILRGMLNTESKADLPTTLDPELISNPIAAGPIVDQTTPLKIDDEFFVLDGQMNAEEDQCHANPHPETVHSERILKSRFKPVLKQLREKIDPLKEEMIEREKRFLQRQGMDMVDWAEETMNSGSDDECDDDLVLRKKKHIKTLSKYNENRKFLEEKTPIALFKLLPVATVRGPEEVIE